MKISFNCAAPINRRSGTSFLANRKIEENGLAKYGKLNHYTCFFRENRTNKFVKKYIQEHFSNKDEIKILSLGCSSGEEARSYAMILDDIKPKVNILGIDLSKEAIEDAKTACYKLDDTGSEKYLPTPEWITYSAFDRECAQKFHKYFYPTGINRQYRLKEGMLNNCSFTIGDIEHLGEIKKAKGSDVIICRYALYHLCHILKDESPAQSALVMDLIAKNFNRALNKDGIVVLGEEEYEYGLDTQKFKQAMYHNGFMPVQTNTRLQDSLGAIEDVNGNIHTLNSLFSAYDSGLKTAPYIYRKAVSI